MGSSFKLDHKFWHDLHESYLDRENPERKAQFATELNLDLLSLSLENFIKDGLARLEGGLTDYKLLDYYGGKIKMAKKGFSRQTLERLYNPITTTHPPPGVLIDLLCSYTYGFRYEDCVSKGLVTDNLTGYQALKNKWQDIADGHIFQDASRTNQSNLNSDDERPTPINRLSDRLAEQDHPEKNFVYKRGRHLRHLIRYLIGSSILFIVIFFYFRLKKSDLSSYRSFEHEINTSPFNKKEPPLGRDCPTLSIGNHTTKIGVNYEPFGCWSLSSVPASAGDDVNLIISYHNSSSSRATNVRVKVIKDRDTTSKKFRFQAKLQCDQGELVSKPVELVLDSANSIFFDHVSWFVRRNRTALPEHSDEADIIEGPGLYLGDIGTDTAHNQGSILVVFGVSGEQKPHKFDAEKNNSPFNHSQGIYGVDCPTMAIGNVSSGQGIKNGDYGCWSLKSITAKNGEFINVCLFFHNWMNTDATNVRCKLYMSPRNGESNHFTFQGKIFSDQGELVSDTVSVHLDTRLDLSYNSTHLSNGYGLDSPINTNMLDGFFINNEGLYLGSVKPGLTSAGTLVGVFQVVKRNDY